MSAPNPAALLADPQAHAHRYVEGADAFRMVGLPRAVHAQGPFLTDEYIGGQPVLGDVPATSVTALSAAPPLHFLFHSAFCNSTQLVRALDHPGMAMGLSEPVVLNDVVGLRRRGAAGRDVARVADLATRLLGRRFADGEAVVVKPSNVVNPLAGLLLALRPQARAVFLFAPLETFLISVARKGLWCRLWVRELLEGYLRDGAVDLGMGPEDHFRQSDLQVAAVGWLAQHRLFAGLSGQSGGRLATLDADRMNADPARALAAVTAHYGLDADPTTIATILSGPAFTRHSKSGEAYDAARRAADYAAIRAAHADEIGKVVEWAAAVAVAAGISLDPPGALV